MWTGERNEIGLSSVYTEVQMQRGWKWVAYFGMHRLSSPYGRSEDFLRRCYIVVVGEYPFLGRVDMTGVWISELRISGPVNGLQFAFSLPHVVIRHYQTMHRGTWCSMALAVGPIRPWKICRGSLAVIP